MIFLFDPWAGLILVIWMIAFCHFDQIHRGHKGGILGCSKIHELSECLHIFAIFPGHEIMKENTIGSPLFAHS
jgi:hypothetical protein